MKLINYSLVCGQISLIVAMLLVKPVIAESVYKKLERSPKYKIAQLLKYGSANSNNIQQERKGESTISAKDLLAQQNPTRVTGVELNQTDKGLQVILETAAGSERLVPLILPEGKQFSSRHSRCNFR